MRNKQVISIATDTTLKACEDIAYALCGDHQGGKRNGVAYEIEEEILFCGGGLTLKDEIGTIVRGQYKQVGNTQDNTMLTIEEPKGRYIVRRLTPTECERLQGYPDGWTDIGEYEVNGKVKKTSDSARYKALGNSIALPYWRFLCKRISALYAGKPTMASLFDGIGGFPLCWQSVNGDGTAVWASEIEEFPIAVTEKHFGENGDWLEYMKKDKYWGSKYGL